MTRPFELVQQFILGALSAALFAGLVWLAVGDTPTWWVTLLAAEAIALAVTVAVKVRRRREQARLQADFERPAFGEDWPC